MTVCQNPSSNEEVIRKLLFQTGRRDGLGGTALKYAIDANNSNAIGILIEYKEESKFKAAFYNNDEPQETNALLYAIRTRSTIYELYFE